MISIKKVCIMFFSICLFLSLLFVPIVILAQDITVTPAISLKGEYDDNVLFARTNEIDDYLAVISPALTLDYASELLKFKASGIVDILRYEDEKDLDTENHKYSINGGYQLMERWNLSGNLSYIKDTTLDSELEETGIVNFREDRERHNAGTGISYQLSELSDMGVNYAYSKTDYDETGLEDYDVNFITLSYNRKFNEGIDVFTIQPRYARLNSDTSQDDGYRLTFGWTHLPSEIYRLRVFLGGRYTVQDFKDDRDTTHNWGGVADINLQKKGETNSLLVGFSSDIYNRPSTGELNQVYKLYGNLTQRIFERLNAGVYSRISLTKPDDNDSDNDKDIWYFVVRPSLSYRLTENHSLKLAYSYSQDYDKNVDDDRRRTRNKVWLSLNFRFPKKW